jgi:hypothetical protein
MMCMATWQIVMSYLLMPRTLPRSYIRFLDRMAGFDSWIVPVARVCVPCRDRRPMSSVRWSLLVFLSFFGDDSLFRFHPTRRTRSRTCRPRQALSDITDKRLRSWVSMFDTQEQFHPPTAEDVVQYSVARETATAARAGVCTAQCTMCTQGQRTTRASASIFCASSCGVRPLWAAPPRPTQSLQPALCGNPAPPLFTFPRRLHACLHRVGGRSAPAAAAVEAT